MQKQFRYIYNNEEVSREDFERLAGDSFKWFDGDSVVSVPFSSFDSFFTGDFKSRRQINDHLKKSFKNGSFVYETKGGKNFTFNPTKPPTEMYITDILYKESDSSINKITDKDDVIFNNPKGNIGIKEDFEKTTKVFLSETEEELKDIISAEKTKTEEKEIVLNRDYPEKLGWQIKRGRVTIYPNSKKKDDVITNSNRGEKETEGKLNYE